MKIVVLGGAGKVAQGAIRDFVEDPQVKDLLLVDINMDALNEIQINLGSKKVSVQKVDLNNEEELVDVLKEYDAVLNGTSHHFNIPVMKACLKSNTNYTDFGGLFHWARQQLELHEEFKAKGLSAVIGSGSAPGIVNVMAKHAYEQLDTVDSVKIRDGIVNLNDAVDTFVPPYAVGTLLDEFTMNPYEFKNGEFIEVAPLSGAEEIDFPLPVGTQTVFNTIHSEVATMPLSFKEKGIKNVTFKLALPKLTEEKLRLFVNLGLGSTDALNIKGKDIVPRDLLSQLVQNSKPAAPLKHADFKVLRVEVDGTIDNQKSTFVLDCNLSPYERWSDLSQGVFSVGYPAAITTKFLANGTIKMKGVYPSEGSIPTDLYFKELKKRGIEVVSNLVQTIC